MKRWIAVLLVAASGLIAGSSRAHAQEASPGPGRLEVSIIPAGGVFFTERTETNEPSFGNYDLGGAVAVNFNRYVGVEGEVSGALGINDTQTFLTGNVGAGVKWYAGRWGLRGDYRFIGVQSKDDAPSFFGRDTRYGHRFYGAVLVNLGR